MKIVNDALEHLILLIRLARDSGVIGAITRAVDAFCDGAEAGAMLAEDDEDRNDIVEWRGIAARSIYNHPELAKRCEGNTQEKR